MNRRRLRVLQNLDEDDDPIEPETDSPTIVRVDCTERPDEVIQALAGTGLELVSREEWT